MVDLTELSKGDTVQIDAEPLSGLVYEVKDVTVEDIGITEVVAVTLLCGSERRAIEWATHSDTAVVLELEGDMEHEVSVSDIQRA